MTMPTMLGTAFEYGGQSDLTSLKYIVLSETPSYDVKDSTHANNAGQDIGTLVMQRKPTIDWQLECLDGATPEADFPKGLACTLNGYTDYYVEDVTIEKTPDVLTVNVKLTKRFDTTS